MTADQAPVDVAPAPHAYAPATRDRAPLLSFTGNAVTQYWSSSERKASWRDVEWQLQAAAASRTDLEYFVRTGLENTWASGEILSLARHPLSADIVRRWLMDQLDPDLPEGQRLIGRRETYDAAFVGAARLLLPAADAERAHQLAQFRNSQYFQIVDSVGHRPARREEEHKPVRHRLLIAEHLANPATVALELPGCDEATVISTSDTFGTADFSGYASWVGSGEIHVEHIRTRITRFSADYAELHEATARLAELIVTDLAAIPSLLHEDDKQFLAVDVADFIFFQSLKIHAIETLLDDDAFDHVVVAIDEQGPQSEFLRLLSAVLRIKDDPRVELVSISGQMRWRGQFYHSLDSVLAPPRRELALADRLPVERILENFSADARRYADEVQWHAPDQPDWILLATLDNPAYDKSTAAYLAEIEGIRPVRILHTGGPVTALAEALARRDVPAIPIARWPSKECKDSVVVDLILRRLAPLCAELLGSAATEYEAAAAKALDMALERLVATRVVPAVLRQKALEHRFATWRQAGSLPSALVLTPHRDPRVGGMAAVARRFEVPSVALEPHMLDANYCRYLKVAADYYGVFSDYFVDNAVRAFGMQPDRVRVVGTPRHVAPVEYDRAAAQMEAREALTAKSGFDFSVAPLHVVFFSQPGDWDHFSQVWDLLVDAAAKVAVHLFLKPHPEEPPSRVKLYLDRAADRGTAASITLLGGAAENAVDIADVVVTCYSATAVDAAVRGAPVVSVAAGDVNYPIDIAAIVDASTARSVGELADFFEAFIQDAGPAVARARALIEREPHFVTGPGPVLRQLVDEVVAKGAAGLRTHEELPQSLFLDGPHPVFPV